MATRVVAIPIFDDVEVLDFCGPFEVFSVASRFTDLPAFKVRLMAEKDGPVVTRGGMSVNAHHRLADCPRPDIQAAFGWENYHLHQFEIGGVRYTAAEMDKIVAKVHGE